MKTVTYILHDEPDRTARDAGSQGRSRAARRDKVVDLTAWKAEHRMEPDGPEAEARPVRRRDRHPARLRWRLADWAELAATLAVAAAFLALAARVLLF